ncbi:uridine kinase [Candidatus Parcubacteria bacterium]|nr:MAG: uridine kinase [Candidatus Parcubacteria bacterium]
MENTPVVIIVAGGTGSGKTTLAREIIRMLGDDKCCRICHDFYYDPESPYVQNGNFDHPGSFDNILMVSHVRELVDGVSVQTPRWDYNTHSREPERVQVDPKTFIIAEGILALAVPELVSLAKIKIYVDTPGDTRLARRIKRDVLERGRKLEGILEQWEGTVAPMHDEFCHPTRRHANLIVPHGGNNEIARLFIQAGLEQMLNGFHPS